MRSRFLAILVLGLCLSPAVAQQAADDFKPPRPDPVANDAKPTLPAPNVETVTIHLHYFFPNYSHGYYIGWTYTIPVQVPLEQAKLYLSGQAAPGTHGTADANPPEGAVPGYSAAPAPWENR